MQNRPQILLILNLPPPYGGGEIRSKFLFNHLANNEKYIILENSRKKGNKSTSGKLLFANVFNGITLIFKAFYYIIRFKPSKLYLSIPKQFAPFIKTGIIIEFAKLFRIKILGELAGGDFAFLKNENYRKKIGIRILRKIDDLRVLGSSVRNNLTKYGLSEITVIDNGIYVPEDCSVTSEIINNPVLNILYVGALNYSKGIKNLVEAVNLLKNAEAKIHLNIMGEWSNKVEKEEILTFIDRYKLTDYITFHGLVTSDLKWSIYRKCQILAHPTFWDGQPLVILEAMGCGLAVISTNIGAIPDTMTDNFNGIILKENTPLELTRSLLFLYNNRQKLEEMSKNNIKTYLEKYTISSYLERMVNWLEK